MSDYPISDALLRTHLNVDALKDHLGDHAGGNARLWSFLQAALHRLEDYEFLRAYAPNPQILPLATDVDAHVIGHGWRDCPCAPGEPVLAGLVGHNLLPSEVSP